MDLRQLNYFVAVAEERNLGRAATRLCLSEPPLSRHIKALETGLGLTLFTRTPRGMELTQAGEALLKEARGIQQMLRQAEERTQRVGRGQAGRLDVGLYGSAIFGVLPRLLARFAAAHPEVELTLHHAQTPAQVPALRQGRVLIVFERLLPHEADITTELVAREPLLLALNEQHPLVARKVVPISALRHERLLIGTSPAAAAMAVELCRRHGFEPQFAPPASDVVMATLTAALGGGVVLVPASMTGVQFPGIAYRRLSGAAGASMDLHCFYLREERSPLLAAMLGVVRGFRAETGGKGV